jgi:hypothetical protein
MPDRWEEVCVICEKYKRKGKELRYEDVLVDGVYWRYFYDIRPMVERYLTSYAFQEYDRKNKIWKISFAIEAGYKTHGSDFRPEVPVGTPAENAIDHLIWAEKEYDKRQLDAWTIAKEREKEIQQEAYEKTTGAVLEELRKQREAENRVLQELAVERAARDRARNEEAEKANKTYNETLKTILEEAGGVLEDTSGWAP